MKGGVCKLSLLLPEWLLGCGVILEHHGIYCQHKRERLNELVPGLPHSTRTRTGQPRQGAEELGKFPSPVSNIV